MNALSERGPHPISRKRQISNQHHRIFSIKAGNRNVVAESQLEAQAIFCAEGDPEIVELCEQPLRIHGTYGKSKYVTLDLSVKKRCGAEIIYEIKPTSRLVEHEDGHFAPANWKLIEAWSEANGHDIRVMTDEWLFQHKTRVLNWKHLLGYVRHFRVNRDPDLETEVIGIITNNPDISMIPLLDHLRTADEQLITSCVASLLHEGKITANLDSHTFTRNSGLKHHVI